MTDLRFLGLDPGFGGFKIAEMVEGKVISHTIPATVGLGRIGDMGLLASGAASLGSRSRRPDKPLELEIDGENFLVGPNVHEYAAPSNRLDYQRLANGPELRALMYAALASRMNGEPGQVSLLIGLPVEVMKDRSLAMQTISALRGWLVGEHRFMMNGSPYEIKIEQIKAMAQPLGSYFAFGMNGSGQWDDKRADWDAPAVVADFGFNTVDLYAIQGGRLLHRSTGGDTLGMHRAARYVIEQVRERFGIRLSLYEADQKVRQGVAGRPVKIYHPGGEADITSLVQAALSQTFADANDFVAGRLKNMEFRYLIMSGGGVVALRQWLTKEYVQAVIFQEPVTANACGLAKMACDPALWS